MERGAKIKFRIASGDYVGYIQDPKWNGGGIWVSENRDAEHVFKAQNWVIRPSDVLEVFPPTQYVLGFLFTTNGHVWLIRKNKPEWQKGLLNGIGGKIEKGETPSQAMSREFAEEGGHAIGTWKWYGTLTDVYNYEVFCFYTISDAEVTSMTDEKVELVSLKKLPVDIIPNLSWLIPMAVSFENGETAKRFVIKSVVD